LDREAQNSGLLLQLKKLPKLKKSPNRRKFAQSGHPGGQSKLLSTLKPRLAHFLFWSGPAPAGKVGETCRKNF
jgi:hypothetical protein